VGEDESVPTTDAPHPHHHRPPLVRPVHGRVVAGVAEGLALHLHLSPTLVRVVIVVLAAAGGAGVVLYAFLWVFVPEEPTGEGPAHRGRRSARSVWVVVLGVALLAVGLAVLSGVSVDVSGWVPLLLVTAGAVFAWSQLDRRAGSRFLPGDSDWAQGVVVRTVAGVVLAVVGLVLLATQGLGLTLLWDVVVAVLVVLVGVAVIATPYATRLWGDLQAEQAARIRATERADIAAHLHDSVLQTLALIQRSSDDPQVTRLARAQERELRQWLYAAPPGAPVTLASAVAEVAHDVEDRHGIPIEIVVTGDHVVGEQGAALVSALREALVNAARHGAPPITAYVEVGQGRVEAFVRDHGPGFDPDAVPADRLGVRESIVGRMARHGGSARVRRLEDGTEISLSLVLEPDEPGPDQHRGTEQHPDQGEPR
jgi:signal transduction histidine kinase/phage shock protein PspC (stress-responsive transcriptional regulator)